MAQTRQSSAKSSAKSTTKSGSPQSRPGAASDALAMLEEDHRRVQKMFEEFEKLESDDTEARQELVETVCHDLEIHIELEEQIFYPAVRDAIEDTDLIEEAEVEHQSAKTLIEQLKNLDPSDPKYAATFIVLGEQLDHHIEEEETEMFKQAKSAKLDFEALGQEMRVLKAELMEEAGEDGEDGEASDGANAKSSTPVRAAGRNTGR